MQNLTKQALSHKPSYWIKRLILLTTTIIIAILAIYFYVPDYLKKIAWGLSILVFLALLLGILLAYLIRNIKKGIRIILITIYTISAMIISFVILVNVFAPSVMFHTYFAKESYEELLTKVNAEELSLETDQGILSGWFLHNAEDNAPLVLYFGGNAENSAVRMLRLIDRPHDLETFSGYNFVFVDYPGYGKSDGTPNAESLRQYGLAVYDAMDAREDVTEIIIMAFSIGTGVANYVSSQRPVNKLILFAPYADGVDLYNNYLNIFHGPLSLLVPFDMEAIKYAEDIDAVPLIIASQSDQIVSYKSSVRLSQAYPLGNQFITLQGVGHNDIWKTPSVLQEVKKYLNTE